MAKDRLGWLLEFYVLKTSNVYMYIFIQIYANMHMKSSFPKRVKRQSKNRGCNGNGMFGDHALEKSSL